ncbi:hypothetical protein [Bifidobacterium pseudolongum]|uniref:hypothetical protein n=1 Tax=Bifidobacterium pseudolongum TaxID=1694 RepID=UPI00102253E2|nr:hypothetical protein [Bifidobacterium pseudolongum]
MAAAKVLVLILPSKYFYDNTRIVSMVNNDGLIPAWSGSYQTTADIFTFLNFLNFQTMVEWSFALGVLLTTLVSLLIFQNGALDMIQELFWLCCIVLLNIYVFNIGKDSIQFIFFYISFIVSKSHLSIYIKSLLIFIVFYIESIYFRSYFILVAVFFVAIVLLTFRTQNTGRRMKTTSYYAYILLIVYSFLIVSSILFPEQYEDVANVRAGVNDGREGAADAATLISNLIPGNSLFIALVNYPINAFRMLLPLELLLKGVTYIPFVIFQVFATIFLIQYSKSILNHTITSNTSILLYAIYLAFLLTSFFFEPDFGSWVRHEMASFPVFQYLFFSRYCRHIFTRKGIIVQ